MGNTADQLITQAESEASRSPLAAGERFVLSLFRAALISGPPLGACTEEVKRLSRLIGDGANFYLVPGEAWSDALNGDLSRLEPARQTQWVALFGMRSPRPRQGRRRNGSPHRGSLRTRLAPTS